MAAERCPGIFVTGTDTGVGKTMAAAALALFLRGRGLKVGVCKPAETGVEDPDGLGADASMLQWAAGSVDKPDSISPYRFRAPLAPWLAAKEEGVRIDPAVLAEAVDNISKEKDFVIVEGAGGLMVPVNGGYLMADLARDVGLPLLIVSPPRLGTINHTLLTVFAARSMGLPIAGFLINGMPTNPDKAEEGAPHALASLASADLLGVLPQVHGGERSRVEKLASEIERLPTLPWLLGGLGLSSP